MITIPPATTLPGCTCHHATGLHRRAANGRVGCVVGWSGAGNLIPGTGDIRTWPAGCSCIAVRPDRTEAIR